MTKKEITELEDKFEEYKKISFPEIALYVDEVKPEYSEELQGMIEEGKSFLYIKKKFYEKFFPQLIPVASPKKPTMKDWLNAKKEAAKK